MNRLCVAVKRKDMDSQWYKDAVIYELYLPSFSDGNGDGIGDLRGLKANQKWPHSRASNDRHVSRDNRHVTNASLGRTDARISA